MKITDIRALEDIAKEIRINILKMLAAAGSVHTGGSLSAVNAVVVIYFSKMSFRPRDLLWRGRDRFIMSKGHAVPLLYAIIAKAGYFSMYTLYTPGKINSPLHGHFCCESVPGWD